MKHGLSHSRKVVFRQCKRKHHLMYTLGIRPVKEAIQLVVGTLLHAWLECWFSSSEWVPPCAPHSRAADDMEEFLPAADERIRRMWRLFAELDAAAPFEAARLRAMVLAYHLRWRAEPWHVMAVEQEFRAPLRHPDTEEEDDTFERNGKIDALVMSPEMTDTGIVALGVEHKSNLGVITPESDYWTKLRSDAQCSDYHIGGSELQHDIHGIVYDVVCKPDLDPLKATPIEKRQMTQGKVCPQCVKKNVAKHDPDCDICQGTTWKEPPRLYANQRDRDETPGEYGLRCFQAMLEKPDLYLHRKLVVRTDEELRQHQLDDWETAQDVKVDMAREHHPRNTDACFKFLSGKCEFHPICFGSVSPTDERIYKLRRSV